MKRWADNRHPSPDYVGISWRRHGSALNILCLVAEESDVHVAQDQIQVQPDSHTHTQTETSKLNLTACKDE